MVATSQITWQPWQHCRSGCQHADEEGPERSRVHSSGGAPHLPLQTQDLTNVIGRLHRKKNGSQHATAECSTAMFQARV